MINVNVCGEVKQHTPRALAKVFLMSSNDQFAEFEALLTRKHLLLANKNREGSDKIIRYKLRKLHIVTSDSDTF